MTKNSLLHDNPKNFVRVNIIFRQTQRRRFNNQLQLNLLCIDCVKSDEKFSRCNCKKSSSNHFKNVSKLKSY